MSIPSVGIVALIVVGGVAVMASLIVLTGAAIVAAIVIWRKES